MLKIYLNCTGKTRKMSVSIIYWLRAVVYVELYYTMSDIFLCIEVGQAAICLKLKHIHAYIINIVKKSIDNVDIHSWHKGSIIRQ